MMVAILLLVAVVVIAAGAGVVWRLLRSRHMDLWIASYLRQWPRRLRGRNAAHTHVHFCFADHYEPFWHKPDLATARARVDRWMERYPTIAAEHTDSNGRHPQHSFFYPEEEYDEVILDQLADLCRRGFGDVEVHLHHDNDTAENLRKTLTGFTTLLHERHGLLRKDPVTGQVLYAFIHGNWALDNSRPDGRWCGVDNELDVLHETGCRMDMTLPSAPSDTQTSKINSIYFAHGEAGCCKSHDHGRDARVGDWLQHKELLMVQGPLALNWSDRKAGIMPRIESSEISADALPTAARIALWERAAIGIEGAENHLFIKVHTHGAEERTAGALLDGGMQRMWTELEKRFRDRPGFSLHYVTAWEMYQQIERLCKNEPVKASSMRAEVVA
ncbi:hypothetical protein [Rhizobacter sp. SG703]|uniref:hypothetical protein n=1 Tax=Rhizobacter sp. SG703 TaxID=2587140 RepID=UPI0014466825|nr:hypothetical protein [Rhizobacter sp. SG703]NKI92877.1 hypothetical protein [Rhizobacter sp. SG703]